jgi:low affinity Fe/Cu permease
MARKGAVFERLACRATHWTGTSWALALALGVVLAWVVTGPLFGFSDTWQLVINTGTTIVTFLMVFLIQRAQNKDAQAIQLKLNELVAAVHGASNRLINVEDLSEKEVEALHRHYCKLVELARADGEMTESHSIEEAKSRHHRKQGTRGPKETSHGGRGGPVPASPSGATGANGHHEDGAP